MKVGSLLVLGGLFSGVLFAQPPYDPYSYDPYGQAQQIRQAQYQAQLRREEQNRQIRQAQYQAQLRREEQFRQIRQAEYQAQLRREEQFRQIRQAEYQAQLRREEQYRQIRQAEYQAQLRREQQYRNYSGNQYATQQGGAQGHYVYPNGTTSPNYYGPSTPTPSYKASVARVSRPTAPVSSRVIKTYNPGNGEWTPAVDKNGSRTVSYDFKPIPSWAKEWRVYKGRIETRPAEDPKVVVARARARTTGYKNLLNERRSLVKQVGSTFDKKWFEDLLDEMEKENDDWYQGQLGTLEKSLRAQFPKDGEAQKWIRERVVASLDSEKIKRDGKLKNLRETLLKERKTRESVAGEAENIVNQGKRNGWSLSRTRGELSNFDKGNQLAANEFEKQTKTVIKKIKESWKDSPEVSNLFVARLLMYRGYRARLDAYAKKRLVLKTNYNKSSGMFEKRWMAEWLEKAEYDEAIWSKKQKEALEALHSSFKKGEPSAHIMGPVTKAFRDERARRVAFLKEKRKQLENELVVQHKQFTQADKLYEQNLNKDVDVDKAEALVRVETEKEKKRQTTLETSLTKERLQTEAEWKKFPGVNALYKQEVGRYPIIKAHKAKYPFRRRTELKLQKTLDYKEGDSVTVLAQIGTVRGFACIGNTSVFVVDRLDVLKAKWDDTDMDLAALVKAAKTSNPAGWLVRFEKDTLVDIKKPDKDLAFTKARATNGKDAFKIFYREYSQATKKLGSPISEFHLKLDRKTNEVVVGEPETPPTDQDEFEDK